MRLDRVRRRRSGKVFVVAIVLLPVFLGMLAMSVDIGVLAAAQAKLRTVSDAGALAGAWALADQSRVRGAAMSADAQAAVIERARTIATAAGNEVLQAPVVVRVSSPSSRVGDVVLGYLDTARPEAGFIGGGDSSAYNSVRFLACRDAEHHGQVPAVFGRVLGLQGLDAYATSVATCQPYAISGFKTVNGKGSGILPIAMDQATYDAMISGDRARACDDYFYDTATGLITGEKSMATSVPSAGYTGGDGICESVIYPFGAGYGNWGTLNIGVTNNSTAILKAQIQNGVTAAQMATYPNSTITTPIDMTGNPGISAGIKSSLVAIIGQVRAIPLYTGVPTGQGANMSYHVVAFGAVRVMDVRFQGNPKYVVVQPALMKDATATPGAPTTWTRGGLVRVRLTN